MSLVHEAEDTSGNANDQPAGANSEMLRQMGPRFTKPNVMTHAVIKPAGSTAHLSCPAEGEYIILMLKWCVRCAAVQFDSKIPTFVINLRAPF